MSGTSKVEEPNESCHEHDQDFSEAWEQSDLILLVEEKQLHVHRAILAMSSPVFSRMFAGDYKERNAEEIPLPGKDYNEIKEMLLAIYPTSWKPVDEINCNFLLALAQEYQMTKLTQKCQDYLMDALAKKQGSDIMETLALAQDYALERVLDECIVRTQSLSIKQLKKHPLYDQIKPVSQRKMIELQMQKGEKETERLRCLADEALKQLNQIAESLEIHIRVSSGDTARSKYGRYKPGIGDYISYIKKDEWQSPPRNTRKGSCMPLDEVSGPIEIIQNNLLEISRSGKFQ